jgi:hypothetical protein
LIAGWSSPVARQAHNLKVLGSNPSPATNFKRPGEFALRVFLLSAGSTAQSTPPIQPETKHPSGNPIPKASADRETVLFQMPHIPASKIA